MSKATALPKSAERVQSDVSARGRKVLFSAMKNEAPFVLEWIAYHQVIGFERIVIFSNESTDGTTELLDALDAEGVIEHYRHVPPRGVSAQANAAIEAREHSVFVDGEWVLWLDGDEFLNVHAGQGRVDDLLDVIGEKHGMLIQWRLFGDSGNTSFPGRFISHDFTRAAFLEFRLHREVKPFFRFGEKIVGLNPVGINRPKIAPEAGLTHADFLNSNGDELADSKVNRQWLAGEDRPTFRAFEHADIGAKVAQVNHYLVRTAEFFALKRFRGRGWAADQEGDKNERHTPEYYNHMNRNGRVDTSILRHERATTGRIAALRALPAVNRAENMARCKTEIALLQSQGDNAARQYHERLNAPLKRPVLTLPPDEAALVTQQYSKAKSVLEYGSGGSSFVALESGVRHLFSVESDPIWAAELDRSIKDTFPTADVDIHYVDIGAVGAWGRPVDSSGLLNYHAYALSAWQQPHLIHPDVVLIDGRFRVSCFWATVMHITRPVTILFDDYKERSEYHWIEAFLEPREMVGRMAVFDVTPDMPTQPYLADIIGSFADAR